LEIAMVRGGFKADFSGIALVGLGIATVPEGNVTVFSVITAVVKGNTAVPGDIATVFSVITMVPLGNTIVCLKNELFSEKSTDLQATRTELLVSGGCFGCIGSCSALFLVKTPSVLVTGR
ncbi:MAG: hypothetical protein GY757_38030, partial [bacterium]|nr:hypothetical protein [bacterium]